MQSPPGEGQSEGVPAQGTPGASGTPGTSAPGPTQGTTIREVPTSDSSEETPLPPGEFYGTPNRIQGEPNESPIPNSHGSGAGVGGFHNEQGEDNEG